MPFALTPEEVKRGMNASIWDAVLAGPFYNLTWKEHSEAEAEAARWLWDAWADSEAAI